MIKVTATVKMTWHLDSEADLPGMTLNEIKTALSDKLNTDLEDELKKWLDVEKANVETFEIQENME